MVVVHIIQTAMHQYFLYLIEQLCFFLPLLTLFLISPFLLQHIFLIQSVF